MEESERGEERGARPSGGEGDGCVLARPETRERWDTGAQR